MEALTLEIREYQKQDEQSWIRCRVLSFMGSSYFDDVQNYRETYQNPAIQMVAVENNEVIGFLDCEYEQTSGDILHCKGGKRGIIWHLGVLPEYQNKKIASLLWEATKEKLHLLGVKSVEVWTQDDEAATNWYLSKGFVLKYAYLNAYLKGMPKDEIIQKYINFESCGEIYNIRCLNFEAPLERKKELEKICYRLHEVRGYELKL